MKTVDEWRSKSMAGASLGCWAPGMWPEADSQSFDRYRNTKIERGCRERKRGCSSDYGLGGRFQRCREGEPFQPQSSALHRTPRDAFEIVAQEWVAHEAEEERMAWVRDDEKLKKIFE